MTNFHDWYNMRNKCPGLDSFGGYMYRGYNLLVNLPVQLSPKIRELFIGWSLILLSLKIFGWCPGLVWSNYPEFHVVLLIRVRLCKGWRNISWCYTCYKSSDHQWWQHFVSDESYVGIAFMVQVATYLYYNYIKLDGLWFFLKTGANTMYGR